MRAQVLLFSKTQLAFDPRGEHGGSIGVGRRKVARPVATRRPIHVVLRSTRATGAWSLRRRTTDAHIRTTMRALAQRYGVRIYELANAGNHLHLLLRAK